MNINEYNFLHRSGAFIIDPDLTSQSLDFYDWSMSNVVNINSLPLLTRAKYATAMRQILHSDEDSYDHDFSDSEIEDLWQQALPESDQMF